MYVRLKKIRIAKSSTKSLIYATDSLWGRRTFINKLDQKNLKNPMKLLALKESALYENRVALTPDLITKYKSLGIETYI
jgi:hypothetical protein